MVGVPKTIPVPVGSEIDRLLDEACRQPIILERERDGVRFRLVQDSDASWADYDPDAVRQAIAEFGGSWANLDIDEMIADVYRAREEGTRPRDRP